MKPTVCCVNKPLEESMTPVMPIREYRTNFFSKKTQKDKYQALLDWAFKTGLFSNMDDQEREKFRELG